VSIRQRLQHDVRQDRRPRRHLRIAHTLAYVSMRRRLRIAALRSLLSPSFPRASTVRGSG
jgi:hypothetical protein